MNIYYYKVTGLDIPRFWGNILKMSVIPGIMLAAGLIVMKFVSLESWLSFLVGVVIYAGIYCLLMYRFAMNDYEKDIIRKPLQKVLNRFHR
jgi:Ca2+/Na+ antiporter